MQGAALAAAATMPNWLARPARAARPRIAVWIISFLNPKADEIIQAQFAQFARETGAEVEVVMVPDARATRRLQDAVAQGRPPDVAMLFDTDYVAYRASGDLLDATDVLDAMKAYPDELIPRAIAGVEKDGRAHGVPGMMNPSPIHWRKDLLEHAGLAYPKDIFEFVEACKAIQRPPHLYGAGICLGRAGDGVQNIQNILWLFGGWMTREDGTLSIDSPGTVEGLKFIDRLYNRDKIVPPAAVEWDATGNNEAYQSGRAAFICNPAAVYSYLAIRDPDLMRRTGLSVFPPGPAGSFSLGGFRAYGVFATTREPALAKEAMLWIMHPERHAHLLEASGGRGVPVYRRLAQRPFWRERPVFEEFLRMPEHALLLGAKGPPSPATTAVANAFILPDMAQDVVLRGMDPAEAAARAQAKAQAIFDRYRAG
jgi:multiple sugar transport system substrate-binding protein